jgi:hypothetical protein
MAEQIHQQCLTTDLPRYIVEGPLPTRSGRIFRGYRVRSNNEQHHHGVSMVCKVALLKAQQQNQPSSQPQSTPTSGSSSTSTTANRASASTSTSTSSVFTSTSSSTTNSNNTNITPINSTTTTTSTNTTSPTTTTINVSTLEEELMRQSQELHRIYNAVSNAETHPHILPYQRWIIPSYSSLSSSNISSNSNSSNNLSQQLTKKKIFLNNPTSSATYTNPSTNAATMASTLPLPIPSSSISSSTATAAASASSGVSNTLLQQQQQQQQPVYLLRQHCYTTLSDRLASRPFLSKVEKLWIIYQILCALQSLHESNVCHGHLTTDNIMVTSWNWIILTDISSHIKPTFLPKDDPSIFIQYFQKSYQQQPTNSTAATNTTDTDLSKRCYLAPERFYNTRTPDTTRTSSATALTPAMDIFSAVCYNNTNVSLLYLLLFFLIVFSLSLFLIFFYLFKWLLIFFFIRDASLWKPWLMIAHVN